MRVHIRCPTLKVSTWVVLLMGLLSSIGLFGGAMVHSYGVYLERGGTITPRMEAVVNRTASSIAAALDAETFLLDGEEEPLDDEEQRELDSSLREHLRGALIELLREPEGFMAVDLCSTRWKLAALSNLFVWVASAVFMVVQHWFLGPPRDPSATVSESWSFISFNLLVGVFLLDPSAIEAPVWLLWFCFTGVAWLLSTATLRKMKESVDGAAGALPKLPLVLALGGLTLAAGVIYCLMSVLAPIVLSLALLLLADWVVIVCTWTEAVSIWAIEAKHARTPGGWPYQTEARVIGRLALEGTAHLVTLAHIAHVWLMHGSIMLSLFNMALISAAQSTLSKMRTLSAMYAALATLYRHLNKSFKEATNEQLIAPEESGSSSSTDTSSDSTGEASEQQQPHQQPQKVCYKECAICLEPMHTAKVLPRCGHIFHKTCIKRWLLGGHGTCPVCRAGFTAEIEERERAQAARREAAVRAREAAAAAAAARPVVVPPPAPVGPTQPGADTAGAGGPIQLPRPVLEARAAAGAGEGHAIAAVASLLRQLMPAAEPVPLNDPRVDTLVDMFPALQRAALAYHLGVVARGSLNATVEAALEGRVREDVPLPAVPAAGGGGVPAVPVPPPVAPVAPQPEPSAAAPLEAPVAAVAPSSSTQQAEELPPTTADGLRQRRRGTAVADSDDGVAPPSPPPAVAPSLSSQAAPSSSVPDTPEVARAKRLAAIERRLAEQTHSSTSNN